MPDFSKLPIPNLLLASTRLHTGSRDNPEIAKDLLPFGGHDKTTADAALALIDQIRDAIKNQSAEEIEQIAASADSRAATAEAGAAYAVHRQRAARAHPRGTVGYTALDLNGRIATAEVPMLAEARKFHEAFQTNPVLLTGIPALTPEDVEEALALIMAAELADDHQTEETGESERATALVAPLVARLRAVSARAAKDAKDALRDKPQLREVLGLMER
ncbi:MAG TPA: hypothetical protein VGB53_02530 [Rubricoccaceae bacterium]|jgi:hypothetical protein